MKRLAHYTIFFALMMATLMACQKTEEQVKDTLPSEIKFTRVDLSGASCLAVMKVDPGQVPSTKTDASPVDRLCILDAQGNAKIATISFQTAGDESNKAWQAIKPTLSLVPERITPLSDKYLLLEGVQVVYDHDLLSEIASGTEHRAILDILSTIGYGFILRLSDGALFKSPVWTVTMGHFDLDMSQYLQVASNGRSFAIISPNYGQDEEHPVYFPVVITDEGSSLKVVSAPSEIVGHLDEDAVLWLMQDGRMVVFNSYVTKTGAWSFDKDMNPTFLDYSGALAALLDSPSKLFTFQGKCYVLTPKGDITGEGLELYEIHVNGSVLDCFLLTSMDPVSDIYINRGTFGSARYSKAIQTKTTQVFIFEGFSVFVSLSGSPVITAVAHPDGAPAAVSCYDDVGRAYVPGLDTITEYNLIAHTKKDIPVQWDKTSCGPLVSGEVFDDPGVGYFTVKGTTRNATTVVAAIEKTTGIVTLSSMTEFFGPVVTTSYRLN